MNGKEVSLEANNWSLCCNVRNASPDARGCAKSKWHSEHSLVQRTFLRRNRVTISDPLQRVHNDCWSLPIGARRHDNYGV